MSIWAIADIHASKRDRVTGQLSKPMDVFGPQWQDHFERLEIAWHERVKPEDTVIVSGDIDWSLKLSDAMDTLLVLASWPGNKLLVRGNHDYWWSSKTTTKVRQTLPPSIKLIHNDCITVEGINVCGAKGSPVPGSMEWTGQDEKILNREQGRLRMSLDARLAGCPTIVAMHYPPFLPAIGSSPYQTILDDFDVSLCIYGHLHGQAAASGPHGVHGRTEYRLVAADALSFQPQLLDLTPHAHAAAIH